MKDIFGVGMALTRLSVATNFNIDSPEPLNIVKAFEAEEHGGLKTTPDHVCTANRSATKQQTYMPLIYIRGNGQYKLANEEL